MYKNLEVVYLTLHWRPTYVRTYCIAQKFDQFVKVLLIKVSCMHHSSKFSPIKLLHYTVYNTVSTYVLYYVYVYTIS